MMTAQGTLAERLGHKPDAKLLIVNCDDLGSSHSANRAIEASLRKGFGSSATLMVPCPWAREAAARCKDLDIGVHLTLTAEYPGYRWRSLTGAKSLHDADGFLPATTAAVYAKADLGHVERECRAQVEQALAWGVDVTHLDSHMGVLQTEPRYYQLYLELAAAYRLPLRMAGKRAEGALGFPIRAPADKRAIVYPDDFFFRWKDSTADLLRRRLPELTPGVAEFIFHPVLDGPELRAYDLDAAQVRIDDHACAVAPETRALLAAERIQTISFRPLRELQRIS